MPGLNPSLLVLLHNLPYHYNPTFVAKKISSNFLKGVVPAAGTWISASAVQMNGNIVTEISTANLLPVNISLGYVHMAWEGCWKIHKYFTGNSTVSMLILQGFFMHFLTFLFMHEKKLGNKILVFLVWFQWKNYTCKTHILHARRVLYAAHIPRKSVHVFPLRTRGHLIKVFMMPILMQNMHALCIKNAICT